MATIQCVGLAAGGHIDIEGHYLKRYDPDTGQSEWTSQQEQAMRFESVGEAFAFWKQTHRKEPVRADGKPNRPLTAFSVTIER